MQRFKAVESSANHKSWEYAKHFELVSNQHFACASQREQETAARMTIRDSQLQRSLKGDHGHQRYQKGNKDE